MNSQTLQPPAADAPVYKQLLVGLLVGCLLGPIVGWFIGTFATFFAVAAADAYPNGVATRGMRLTAFVGGLLGLPLGLVVGALVGVPVRLLSAAVIKALKNVWAGGALGSLLGLGAGLLIHRYWHPSPEAFVYTITHSVVVGASVGAVAVLANPTWLHTRRR
ncbi:MAG: hypothetical protein JOZ96_21195 [Acidobacteria bacterium]|nr:hypothetical protein [Acidobacteriota bacterium]